MKIIQSYNTHHCNGVPDANRAKCGYSTVRGLMADLKEYYKIHSKYDYIFYTDIAGYELVKDFISKEHIEIIEFPIIDERNPYLGKFEVHKLQNEPYIHVDLDAVLYEIPEGKEDIITEKRRKCTFRTEVSTMEIPIKYQGRYIRKIICSGLIGFNDIEFKNRYVKAVIEKALWAKENVKNLDFPCMVANEEYILTMMQLEEDKTVLEIPLDTYIHKQGRVK